MDEIIVNGHKFHVLSAVTENEQAIGLMGKVWPPPILMFPYKTAAVRKFWMKNTPSPLDIVFCRSGNIIAIYKGEPHSTRMIGPDEPADLVIEFPYGPAAKLQMGIGDLVTTSYSARTASKIILAGLF